MDESWKHYGKYKKPDTEDTWILHEPMHLRLPEYSNPTQKVDWPLLEAGGREAGEWLLMVSFDGDKNVLEFHSGGGDGYTTLWILLLNGTLYFVKGFYLFIFRQRGTEGERKGEKHQCVVDFHRPPTGDLAHNPGMCPDWGSNRWPFGSHADTQSTEPHQPGLNIIL